MISILVYLYCPRRTIIMPYHWPIHHSWSGVNDQETEMFCHHKHGTILCVILSASYPKGSHGPGYSTGRCFIRIGHAAGVSTLPCFWLSWNRPGTRRSAFRCNWHFDSWMRRGTDLYRLLDVDVLHYHHRNLPHSPSPTPAWLVTDLAVWRRQLVKFV